MTLQDICLDKKDPAKPGDPRVKHYFKFDKNGNKYNSTKLGADGEFTTAYRYNIGQPIPNAAELMDFELYDVVVFNNKKNTITVVPPRETIYFKLKEEKPYTNSNENTYEIVDLKKDADGEFGTYNYRGYKAGDILMFKADSKNFTFYPEIDAEYASFKLKRDAEIASRQIRLNNSFAVRIKGMIREIRDDSKYNKYSELSNEEVIKTLNTLIENLTN